MILRSSFVSIACVAALAACGGGDSAENGGMAGDSAASAVSPQAASAGTGAPVAGEMSDANIAAVVSASNQDEIQTSRVALEKGENAGVRAYAQQMVDAHTRMEQEMMQLLQSRGITPQDNAQSTRMKQATQSAVQAMQATSGREFDAMYFARQTRSHQRTMTALETMLIPNARDPQLKAMLEAARPAISEHLVEARKLRFAPPE